MIKEGDKCPYCKAGTMESEGGALHCSHCGEYIYPSHED